MNRDIIVAVFFLALAAALLLSSYALPAGMGRVPGPGFFPQTIGAVMAVLGALLLVEAFRNRSPSTELGDIKLVALAAVLTLAYLLAWGLGPFALRTVVFMTLFLRLVGQSWKSSASVAVALTAFVALTFQTGLRVSFD